jgi:hypothetical protein
MGVTRTESHEEDAHGPRPIAGAEPAASPHEAPTAPMLFDAVGERCVNCGAPLASDQRYCVQCGERRGKSRFAVADTSAAPPPSASRTVTATTGSGRRRPNYGTTLVAGIATLLLAMGVGVEIGRINHDNGTSAVKSPATTVITVGGGGTAAAATHSTAHTAAPSGKSAHGGKTSVKKAKQAAAAPKPTKAAVQKASHAASSVLGSNGGQQNATVTTGQSCSQGSAGCSNGHFDGTFFGQ